MEIDIDVCCSYCGYHSTILVNSDDYNRWKDGVAIEKAMPNLSEDEQETLDSGVCFYCRK